MTAALEAMAAEEFIYTTLHGDATLMALVGDIWETTAPQGATYPMVVYQFMSGVDYATVGAYRIWTNLIYLIKVVGQTANYADLSTAVARIDTLLHRGNGTVTDGIVWSSTREAVFRMPEDIAGKPYRSSGATYRIYAT